MLEDVIVLEGYLAHMVLPINDKPTEDALVAVQSFLLSAILPSEDFAFASMGATSQY